MYRDKVVKKNVKNILLSICDVKVKQHCMHTVAIGMDKIISIVNTQVINIPKFRVQNENKKSSREIIRYGCTLVHHYYA
jgi:hypothetical protein